MQTSPAAAGFRARFVALVSSIPQGYVAAIGDVSLHLGVFHRHVLQALHGLAGEEGSAIPWWRVVADGGAIGRHSHREDQIARLKTDGVPLSPVGIVQEFADRRVKDLSAPPKEPFAFQTSAADPSASKPARSRGMKSHPGAGG